MGRNTGIDDCVAAAHQTVLTWRERYSRYGLHGPADRGRFGRPRHINGARVITATPKPPSESSGLTHWSSRALAKKLGINNATVARTRREYVLQPWRAEGFLFSTNPELEAKVTDVVGLCLDPHLVPPENALVLCVDEKSQIQALDRTGKITARCKGRHRHQEFLVFLRQVARACPEVELHLVMDNDAARKHQAVKDWLAANRRIHVHFTQTHASWMTMVQIFGITERQASHRGIFRFVRDLTATIRRFIDSYNKNCRSFIRTKTADQVLRKAPSVQPLQKRDTRVVRITYPWFTKDHRSTIR